MARYNFELLSKLEDVDIKDILHAEAIASDKAMSNLVQGWIDEQLDLAESI